MLNAIKKLRRVEDSMVQAAGPKNLDEAALQVAKEIGDTALYLDLLAQRIGWNLEDCIKMVFNAVSEREGFPERL